MFRNPKHSKFMQIIVLLVNLQPTCMRPTPSVVLKTGRENLVRSRENYPLLLRSVEIYATVPTTGPKSNALQIKNVHYTQCRYRFKIMQYR